MTYVPKFLSHRCQAVDRSGIRYVARPPSGDGGYEACQAVENFSYGVHRLATVATSWPPG